MEPEERALGSGEAGGLAGFSRRYSDIDVALVTTAGLSAQVLANFFQRGAPFASWAERARSFAAAETLEPKDHKPYLRTLLYPGRFCYSWITGLMGSNDDAVAFLRERHPAGLDVGSIDRALQCRQSAADPDALFPARKVLPSQIDACAALLSGESSPSR